MDLDLASYVRNAIDPVAVYSAIFPAWSSTTRPNVTCPFHDDRTASLSVALHGGGAKCHASSCGRSFGNVVHFESARLGIDEPTAAAQLYDQFVRPVVRSEVLANFQNGVRLPAGQRLLHLVETQHGLRADVTSQFGCGYDTRSNRLVIPIHNAYGLCINLRFYKPRKLRTPSEPTVYNFVENKGLPTERKYGGNELFPWTKLQNITDDYPVFIVASEKEAMLAYQLGLQAVCATAGEGSWQPSWSQMFVGRRVGLLMDPDAGGDKATSRLVTELASVSLSTTPVRLPFPRGFRGPQDLDDWVVHCGGTGERLLALHDQLRTNGTTAIVAPAGARRAATPGAARRVPSGVGASVPQVAGTVESLAIPAATGPRLPEDYSAPDGTGRLAVDAIRATPGALNRVVTSHGLVSGIAQRSYSIPYKFRIKPKQGPPTIYVIPVGRQLLGFINATDKAVVDTVLGLCNANARSTTIEVLEHQTVTELELIPLAESAVESGDAGTYTVQRCFAFGVGVQANVAYAFRLVPTTMPQTQETVAVILEATELDRQDKIELTDEVIKRLRAFSPGPEKGNGDSTPVWQRLDLLAREISEHHTHIYERPDWHMVVLLTFFCPLQWTWPLDGKLQRGWLNTLAVGDTKTGKSEVTGIVTSHLLKIVPTLVWWVERSKAHRVSLCYGGAAYLWLIVSYWYWRNCPDFPWKKLATCPMCDQVELRDWIKADLPARHRLVLACCACLMCGARRSDLLTFSPVLKQYRNWWATPKILVASILSLPSRTQRYRLRLLTGRAPEELLAQLGPSLTFDYYVNGRGRYDLSKLQLPPRLPDDASN